jgi:hypothetical protein
MSSGLSQRFKPTKISPLQEVSLDNLEKNKEYLIETNNIDNNTNEKVKGIFQGKDTDWFSNISLPSNNNNTKSIQNSRTRFYKPIAQELLNKQAIDQHVAYATEKKINKKTKSNLGTIMRDYLFPNVPRITKKNILTDSVSPSSSSSSSPSSPSPSSPSSQPSMHPSMQPSSSSNRSKRSKTKRKRKPKPNSKTKNKKPKL